MNNQPLVSIIIPTYNRAHLIGETLDSVLAQTYQNWECIIVDDGSNDQTDEVVGAYVEKDPRFQYFHRPEEHLSGGNGARNFGFKMSRGEYVNWFDSDDLMVPEKLELQVFNIKKFQSDLVVSDFSILGDKQKPQGLNFTDILKFHISKGTINTPMCMINKASLSDMVFDEELLRGQEYEFFTRFFFVKKPSFTVLNKSLCKIRVQQDSITGKYLKGNKDHILSSLKIMFYAYKCSKIYSKEVQSVTSLKFKIALWKSFVFKHENIYFEYLNLYFKSSNHSAFFQKQKYTLMAKFYFLTNRGALFFKRYFLK